MNQLKLFENNSSKISELASMRMTFDESDEGNYTGMVEINSNKFRIMFDTNEYHQLQGFEIISAKWYFDLNLGIIKLVRSIVCQLFSRYHQNLLIS